MVKRTVVKVDDAGSQFTCFTSTKVQILKQKALQARKELMPFNDTPLLVIERWRAPPCARPTFECLVTLRIC